MNYSIVMKTLLKGIGQVMLQNNAVTGLLFLIGIFYNSWLMGLGALLGVVVSTLTALLLRYPRENIKDGLYGFNGTLVGIAVLFFFQANVVSIILIVVGSALSSVIMYVMHEKKLYPFTFPFVLSTWALFMVNHFFNLVDRISTSLADVLKVHVTSAVSTGFGQVMFQGSIVTGVVFFVALLVSSRRVAIFALCGSIVGMLVAWAMAFPTSMITAGIFGYNAVLCAIAFSDKQKSSWVFAGVAAILSVLIVASFDAFNLIALTAPFVFATWITLGIKKLLPQKKLSGA